MKSSSEARPGAQRPPLSLLLLALLLFAARFGYAYAISDQDELLPLLAHMEDEALFAHDWFVGTQTAHLSVRSYFVWLLYGASRILPLPVAVLLGYASLWIAVAWQTHGFVFRLVGDRTAASIAVLAVLVATHKWAPGGNDLVYTMLVPELLAWALALLALNRFMDQKVLSAAALLAIAAWFQLLVGLLLALVLGLLLLWDKESRRRNLWFGFGLVFLVTALPILIPIGLQQVSGDLAPASEVFYVLAAFRNPHHHLPFSFPPDVWIKFALLMAFGMAGYLRIRRFSDPEPHVRSLRFAIVSSIVLCIGVLFSEVFPVLLVTKLQVFKLTPVLKLLAMGYAVAGMLSILPAPLRNRLDEAASSRWLQWPPVVLVGLALAITSVLGGPYAVWPNRSHDPGFSELGAWAQANTPNEAVFAVPPSASWFRSVSNRSILVNYNAFPFRDADMLEWYERISAIAPVGHPERGVDILPALEVSYRNHEQAAWRILIDRFDIDFVLLQIEPAAKAPPCDHVFTTGSWRIYDCRTAND